eukprot:COSAG01_NODE_368_length_18064_cov_5.721959_1_plen_4267_part_10
MYFEMGDIHVPVPQRQVQCTDIDECLQANGNCGDSVYTRCENRYGQRHRCRDINECEFDNGGCGDPLFTLCINHENHNRGGAAQPFTPLRANNTCRDIDECAVNNGGCGDAKYFSCINQGGEGGGQFTPAEASKRNVGPQLCDDIDECAVDNGECGSARHFACANNWGAAPSCSEVCLSTSDVGYTSVDSLGSYIANFSTPNNPCAPDEADFWACSADCFESATRLAEHGCYSLFLAQHRRERILLLRSIASLDAAHAEKFGALSARPTDDDPTSSSPYLLSGLQDIQQRCFDPVLVQRNRTHLYRNLVPVLPCEATGATEKVGHILDEFKRVCPMDGQFYDTQKWFDDRVGSYTRNQWIDINVTHTMCNNRVCASAMLATAASLRPFLSLCRDQIGTDSHYWDASSLTQLLATCEGATVGSRVTRILTSCVAASDGPGPGLFPTAHIPCSAECSALLRSEQSFIQDLEAAPASDIDRDVLKKAFYMLQDECQAAFPTKWFKPRYGRGLLFGVARSGVGPGGTILPRPGLDIAAWPGHGYDGTAALPALTALDSSTGRVYPVSTLPIHEHTPGVVCFDEINQVYYLIGVRLANDNKNFRQTTHLLGVSVLSGAILLDTPFPYRVVSMRYDNTKSAIMAVVMHSARPWDSEQLPHVYDERALVQVSTINGTITRIGLPVLPTEEAEALPLEQGVSICARASGNDGLVETSVAQLVCPDGLVINKIEFASFGVPGGTCGNYSINPACHAPLSQEIAEAFCLTLPACALRSDSSTWGADPCPNMLKWSFLQAHCAQPRSGRHEGDVFSLDKTHATLGLAVLDPVEELYYTVVHPKNVPYAAVLLAINTQTGVVRWETKLPHALAAVELNKRHASLVDALQPPYAFPHYRGTGAQRPPLLAPWLQQARILGIGGQGSLDNHHVLYMDPLNRSHPVIHDERLFDRIVNKTMHEQGALRLAALAEELAFNQTLGWALAVMSNLTNATSVDLWLDELELIETANNISGVNLTIFDATKACRPHYDNVTQLEIVHELFDPFRCLDAMGVNATTLAQQGVQAVMKINTSTWASRDWVWSKLEERETAARIKQETEHNAWMNSVYDGDTRSRFNLALSAFDAVTGVFYSVIDDWSGQSRIVGINSTDGDIITNKTMSEPVQDIFVSELPYIIRLDPWAGGQLGETLINISCVNLYSTERVECRFSNPSANFSMSVPATFDAFTRSAACVAPEVPVPGDTLLDLRLNGSDTDSQGIRITNTVPFSYHEPEQVYRIRPAYGPRFGGTDVTVEGSFFFGDGTVNELYCVFNGIRSPAQFLDEHSAACTSPPEALYTHLLRSEALKTSFEATTNAGNAYGLPHPGNLTDAPEGNGLPFNLLATPSIYGFDSPSILQDGIFAGEMNGPIFMHTLVSRSMELVADLLKGNLTGFGSGLASDFVFEGEHAVAARERAMRERPVNSTDPLPIFVEFSPNELLFDIQRSIVRSFREAPAVPNSVKLAAEGALPTETRVGKISFPYLDGRPVYAASDADSTWEGAYGNATVQSTAQSELEHINTEHTASQHRVESIQHFFRNQEEVFFADGKGPAPEGIPRHEYPSSARFVYDFDFDLSFNMSSHDAFSFKFEEEVCGAIGTNCIKPKFSYAGVLAKAVEAAFPMTSRNTSSLFPCWGLNSSTMHTCYGIVNVSNVDTGLQCKDKVEASFTIKATQHSCDSAELDCSIPSAGMYIDEAGEQQTGSANELCCRCGGGDRTQLSALHGGAWIMSGLNRSAIDKLMPMPRATYDVCRSGTVNSENTLHKMTGVIHDGTPLLPYQRGSRDKDCGRILRAPAGHVVRLTFTQFQLRRDNFAHLREHVLAGSNAYDFLRIYDGTSTFANRLASFDGFDEIEQGTIYSTQEEMLVHFHVEAEVIPAPGVDPTTGMPLPPLPPPPPPADAGWTAEYAFVPLHTLGSTNGSIHENKTVAPESVISFSSNNMTKYSMEWNQWQELTNFSLNYNATSTLPAVAHFSIVGPNGLVNYSPTGRLKSAPTYECMIAWGEWVSSACCPGICTHGLPRVCSAFCADVYARWWAACSTALNTSAGMSFLQPAVHSNLSAFNHLCERTITPTKIKGAVQHILRSTMVTALNVTHGYAHSEKFTPTETKPKILPIAFEFTVNGQRLTSDGVEFSYYDQAEVYSIFPVIGPDSGRTKIQVNGSNFINSAGLTCSFGNRHAKAIYLSSKTIYCVTPKPALGGLQAVNVRVSNNRQQFTDQSNLFDYFTAPNISKVEPTAGPERGGTLVYIDGNHFIQYVSSGVRTSITCRFGNTVVTATLVTSQLLTCLAPKHPPGTFKFSVSLNDQQYTDFPFYFTFYGIDTIYPPLGPLAGKTQVMIMGRGFSTGDVQVELTPRCRFGDDFVDAEVMNSTNMYCISPASSVPESRRFDISFSGDQWTRSGANFSYHLPAKVLQLAPFYDGKGLGPAGGGSRVTVTGENFIDVSTLRCRFSFGFSISIDVPGFFISNTSMYCLSPAVDVQTDEIYLLEMSYNDQQYTGVMSGTKLPYLFYPSFVMESRSPTNAPFGGGFSLGSFYENSKRAVIYEKGSFDFTEVTIEGENFKQGDLTLCRWRKAYTSAEAARLQQVTAQRKQQRLDALAAQAAAADQTDDSNAASIVVPPPLHMVTKCDKYGCFEAEETSGCMCDDNVEDLATVVGNEFQVTCDDPNAPTSCAGDSAIKKRSWTKREGCYITHTGEVSGCPSNPAKACCFSDLTITAKFLSRTEMKCKPVRFDPPSGMRWTPNNNNINPGKRAEYAAQHGIYINRPFTYDFDITRNGQDYSGSGKTFVVYGERSVTYIEPGSGPAEGGLVTSLYGEHFVDSPSLEIRFGAYTPPGAEVPACNFLTSDADSFCLKGGQLPCRESAQDCVDGPQAFALINTTTLLSQWRAKQYKGVAGTFPVWLIPENVWGVAYESDVKITTVNPYHGQTAKVAVTLTSNLQQYEESDLVYSYSSSSAAMTEVTGATDGVIAGNWATFRIEAREANGAPKIEGGDVFVVELAHQHPNYHPPLCMHCPQPVTADCPCPYVLHSGLTGTGAEEGAEIIIENPYSNGLYIVTYMTTIAGLYAIDISLANTPVPGSPFQVEIKFDALTTATTFVYGAGLDEVKAGYSGDLYIQARDQYHNNRTVGRDMPSFCVDITHFDSLDDGTCSFCHPCPFPDANGIYWGRHADYPANTLIDGSVVREPMRDECVMLFDEQIEDIKEKGKNTQCELADCGIICDNFDGTYVVQWTAIKAKPYEIKIARGASRNPGEGQQVPGSPFDAEIVAGDTSVFGCLSEGNGRFGGVAGSPETIRIRTSDLYGNRKTYGGDEFPWELTRAENGVTYKITDKTTDNNDGTYQFTYIANTAATYTLSVKLIAQQYPDPGEFIVDSPWFNVKIVPAPAAASHCRATGENINRALSGYASSFWVTAFDMFDNARTEGGDIITVKLIDGPKDIPDCKDAPGTEPDCVSVMDMAYGTYMVAYVADVSGMYNLSVTLTEIDAKGVSTTSPIGGAYCGSIGTLCCGAMPAGLNMKMSDWCPIRGDTPDPAPFYLRVVPEAPTLLSLSPRSGPISGDTLVQLALQFETMSGPRSRADFEGWLGHLGKNNMTIQFTGWDGEDVDGDPVDATGTRWEVIGWYDFASGMVMCYVRSFYDDVFVHLQVPVPGDTSYAQIEVKADYMDYTRSDRSFYFYDVPVEVTFFSPRYGPDSGFTALSVQGNKLVTNAIIDQEVKCKFGDQEGFQATFILGTGILLCLSDDYRQHAVCGGTSGIECPAVTTVPLTVALNGQQYTQPSLNFNFYKTPVVVNLFEPLSGPLTGGTQVVVSGTNFFDTGIISCKWGTSRDAEAPATYNEGSIECASPRVSSLDNPYEMGDYDLQVALNGEQYSSTPASQTPLTFFFYVAPRVASISPDLGLFTGGTNVALSAMAGAPFVQPGGTNQIKCMFAGSDSRMKVTGVYDIVTGAITCDSPAAPYGMTAEVEVALNGQQFTSDKVAFAYTPRISALDIHTGPTSGRTIIAVTGSGFQDTGNSLVCRFEDQSGADIPPQFLPAGVSWGDGTTTTIAVGNATVTIPCPGFYDSQTVLCTSPPNDLVNPYPNMYPTKLEISMDACPLGTESGTAECPFGDHYSSTSGVNTFSYYEDPVVKTLGHEPYNSGPLDGSAIGFPLIEGEKLTIGGSNMVTVADPMPPMVCVFTGVPDGTNTMTTTYIIVVAAVDVASETVSCELPDMTDAANFRYGDKSLFPDKNSVFNKPQDVAVELSLNS